MSALRNTLTQFIVEQLGVKPTEITPESNFIDELGADSLDLVELVMALEEEFNIEISDEDWEKVHTVSDAEAMLIRLGVNPD